MRRAPHGAIPNPKESRSFEVWFFFGTSDVYLSIKIMRVGDQFRTNPLSLKPGGSIVTVVFSNGKMLDYDKVKSPKKYVASIPEREEIVAIYVNGNQVWTDKEKKKFWDEI